MFLDQQPRAVEIVDPLKGIFPFSLQVLSEAVCTII